MNRATFIRNSLALGIGWPLLSSILTSCETGSGIEAPNLQPNFSGKVIIVGAGAAGMAAAYLLQRYGIDFQIIEAGSDFGGRVKRAEGIADFPIDLGAEWIHTNPTVLADIIDDPAIDANIDFVTYNPQTYQAWHDGRLVNNNFARHFYSEYKFKNTTWYGFFERYIVPSFVDKLVLNQPITNIDYSGEQVRLTAINNTTYEADRVIITTPIKVLQGDTITFTPELPTSKREAIDSIFMGDGLKVFIEFREKFYPDLLVLGKFLRSISEGDQLFYDAAFRKDATRHVLGLFSINDGAAVYTSLGEDEAIIAKILTQLDEVFDGKASANYVQHVIQNWSREPYIQGSYSTDFSMDTERTMNTIKEPIDNKIYFAGEALSLENQATVHGACESGYAAIELVLS